jgi:hypothetical protein
MVKGWQVTPHHRDQVTAGLTRAAGRQQPQFPGALHRRGAVTDLERRDDRHLPSDRAIQGSKKITPVDQSES